MANTKTTKRALLASVISLLICVSMLIGSTFAWFTDTATTGVNTIQAGNLKIALLDADGESLEGESLEFVDLDSNDLWEPGCTYTTETATVKNTGDLYLIYTIDISGINGDAKLNEVLNWTFSGDGAKVGSGKVLAPGESASFAIKAHMLESANNDYQGLSLSNVAITVNATQTPEEYDSFDNKYDEAAHEVGIVKTYDTNALVSYEKSTNTYTIYHSGTTVDYVGATINLNEGYDPANTTCRWVYTKLDGTHVDESWLVESERATYWIDSNNNYQMWVNPGQTVTYYYDMENDGVVDITVIFNALGATKTA